MLALHRYDDVADVVRRLESDSAADDPVLRGLLGAALELCAACSEHEAEAEAHRLLADRLRARLDAVLGIAAGNGTRPAGPGAHTGAAPAGGLAVRCLGPMQVYRGERLLGPWPNRRAKSVFKYLVVHRARPVAKERLMDQFWPEASAAAARNNLNVAIHGLRRFLRVDEACAGLVRYREDCYLIDPDVPMWVDIEEFDRQVAVVRRDERPADVRRAHEVLASLYRGPLFDDDPYEEWVGPARQRLHDEYVDILDRACHAHFAASDYLGCAAVARRILAVEPTHEASHCALMRCYARLGRHHLAQRQYERYAAALRAELDVEPGEQATGLLTRIRRRMAV